MRISKKVKRAMDEADKAVRKAALKPKKKKRIKKVKDKQISIPGGKWIQDDWGTQGEVFFDGYGRYWGIFLEPSATPSILNVVSRYWSSEKWENRKKSQPPKLETTETEELSSTPKITKSTKTSKKVLSGKSTTKSGKTVTHAKRKQWQWTSSSPEERKTQ